MNLQLSLKYRPKNFDDVIYHEEVKRILINSILSCDISNAFLFYGDRGTGKTTVARIFAKALNCENLINKFDPCNSCFSCNEINAAVHPDIFEIDAASKNTVDSVRELIDGAKYLPIRSKYKIYILDEVHMFSNSAFNSLLKILEEPPKHVRFILNTTENHKIPNTVISRCQRLNFKKIPDRVIADQLQKICHLEFIKIESNALKVLSSIADGSLRDGISLLDQVSILTKKNIKLSDLSAVLGYQEDVEILIDLIIAALSCDAKLALSIFYKIYQKNVSYDLFFEKILDLIVNFITVKATGNDYDNTFFVNVSLLKIEEFLKNHDLNQLNLLWDCFANGYKLLKLNFYSNNFNLMNLTILRCCCINLIEKKSLVKETSLKKISESNLTIDSNVSTFEESIEQINYSNSTQNEEVVLNDIKDNSIKINDNTGADIEITETKNIDELKNINDSVNSSNIKNFTHNDLIKILHGMNESDMVVVAKQYIGIFDYEKYEILDKGKLPSKYLQFLLKILRKNTEKKWKIVIVDDGEVDQNVNLNTNLDNTKSLEEDSEKNLLHNSVSEIQEIKEEFCNSSEFFQGISKTFNISFDNVKVSK
jgi:DNA polymerase-3 subunit gamma/tau